MILYKVHMFIISVLLLSADWNVLNNSKIKSSDDYYVNDVFDKISTKKILLKTEKKSFQLGEKITTKNHPKAKGVNMEIRSPLNWSVLEGDRPNVVKKFTDKEKTYVIIIVDNITFHTKKKSFEILSNDTFENRIIDEVSGFLTNSKVLEKNIITIDSYPTLKFKIKGLVIFENNFVPVIINYWMILYEDKIIHLNAMENTAKNVGDFDNLFNLITYSIVFPDQYL